MRGTVERLGAELRQSRRTRRLTQRQLAAQVGLSQSTISDIELGLGGSLSLDTWQRLAIVLGRDLRIALGRDPLEAPGDAGHLEIQELLLRSAPTAGYLRRFELGTRSRDPALSTDVGFIAPAARRLVLIECINTVGDLGAAVRSSDRKRREAEDLATSMGGGSPWTVHTCWVVRDGRRNRALVARYPAIFATRFPGSSVGWLRALTRGDPPPSEPGLVWADIPGGRLFARRVPAATDAAPRDRPHP